MALYHIGGTRYKVLLVQNGRVYETVVKDKITITREMNAASKLTCSILRDTITPEVGNNVMFILDDQHNQFYGYIVNATLSKQWCDIEAYDQLYYMNRNKMRLTYENSTATQVLERIARDRGYSMLEPPQFEDTGYIIPSRIEENVSELTIVTTALDLTYENTGNRFYVWDDFGSLTLTSESWMAGETTCFISMGFIEDYSYTKTLEDKYTASRLEKVIDHDKDEGGGQTIETYMAYNNPAIEKFGFLELHEQLEEEENGTAKSVQLLDSQLAPGESLSLTGVQGDITVRGGTPIAVDFFTKDRKEFIRGWFRVTSVTHTIGAKRHVMDIECEIIEMKDQWNNNDPNYWSASDIMR